MTIPTNPISDKDTTTEMDLIDGGEVVATRLIVVEEYGTAIRNKKHGLMLLVAAWHDHVTPRISGTIRI